jgi:hypothetical protein
VKRIATSIEMAGTPDQVWRVLTDFPAHAEWNPFFASVVGEARVGSTLVVTARKGEGTGFTFRPKVLSADPARLLKWKGSIVVPGLFDGIHEFELTSTSATSTRFDHRESFRGLLVPFLGKMIADAHVGFAALDAALAKRVADVFSLKVGV